MKPALKLDPITGPLTREAFQEAVVAPFGEAKKIIRRFDPMWGRPDGEKFTWRVRVRGTMFGTAYVEAASEEEANDEACNLRDADIDWNDQADDFEIDDVEPK